MDKAKKSNDVPTIEQDEEKCSEKKSFTSHILKESASKAPNCHNLNNEDPIRKCNIERTYQKRKGVIDDGKEYEYLMCALYALRFCTNEDVEDFEMTTNNEKCGDFDDIELKVIFKNKNTATWLFQLKHKYKSDKITQQMLTKQIVNSKKSKFYIKQYLDSITKLTQNVKHKPENPKFILFTNSEIGLQNDEKLTLDKKFQNELVVINRSDDLEHKNLIVNVESNKTQNCCLQFNSTNDNCAFSKEVVQSFYMLHQQNNLNSVKKDVDLLLKKIVSCDIFNSFEQFMRGWWADNYVLTKHHIITKLTELALSSSILPISDTKCNEKTELLKTAIMKFQLTAITNDKIVAKIWNVDEEIAKNAPAIFSSSSDKLKEKILWFNKKAPLVIKMDHANKTTIEHVLKLLKNDETFGPIVLVGEEINDQNIFRTLSDLCHLCEKESFFNNLMEIFKVSIQGKSALSLKSLLKLDAKLGETIKTEHLCEITQTNHLIVGEINKKIPELHIPRKLSIYVTDIENLIQISSNKENVILIVCENEHRLKECNSINLHDAFSVKNFDYDTCTNIFQISKFSFFDFDKLCAKLKNRNLYVFKKTDEKSYILVLRKGNSRLQNYRFKAQISEKCIMKFSNPLNVFCAPPGMGKSRLMKVLSHYCSADARTININLIDYNNFLFTNPDYECIKSHFINTKKHKDANILQNLKKVVLLLDGLDELDSKYVDTILNFVKTVSSEGIMVCLSSRENLREKICKKLNVIPVEIEQLNESQQKEYIQDKLHEKYKKEEITKITKAIETSYDFTNSKDLLGIPLQLHIITEMFLNDDQAFKNLNKENVFVLTKMYKLFFEGKFKSHFEKFPICPSQIAQIGITPEQLLKSYELVALKSCLDENDFIKLGLNYDSQDEFINRIKIQGDKFGIIREVKNSGNVIFDHQTYAEYFAGAYLKKNKDKILFLKETLFREKYENLRKFLDIMLAENHPLHMAVIYKNEDQFQKHFNNILNVDEGGRTVLHLLCNYGEDCLSKVGDTVKYKLSDLIRRNGRNDKIYIDSVFSYDPIYRRMMMKTLQHKENFHFRDEILGLTASEYAFLLNNFVAIECILQTNACDKKIAKILQTKRNRENLILLAVLNGWYSILASIIKDKNLVTEIDGYSLILFAVLKEQNEQIIRLLLYHNSNLNQMDEALHLVCKLGNIFNLKTLIECSQKLKLNLNLNAKTKSGGTALHLACFEGHLEIVKFLIEKGASVNLLDGYNKNPLHTACKSESENLEIVRLLLDYTNVNDKMKNGATALHLACYQEHFGIVKLLMENGADAKILYNGKNLLHFACNSKKESLETVQLLLNHVTNLDARTKDGNTALHFACLRGHFNIVKMLIENGADDKILNNHNKNVLHFSCESEQPSMDVVQFFLNRGFDLNAKTKNGETILHFACLRGHFNIVKLLLENSVDANILNNNNENVLHFACDLRNEELEMVQLLLDHNVDLNVKTRNGNTPLYLAFFKKHFNLIKLLLKNNADANILNNNGKNLLHFACNSRTENLELAQLLLNYGVNINATTKDGENAFQLALKNKNFDTCKLLIENGADVTDSE